MSAIQIGINRAKKRTTCRRDGCSRPDIIKGQKRGFVIWPRRLTYHQKYSEKWHYHLECKPIAVGDTLQFPDPDRIRFRT